MSAVDSQIPLPVIPERRRHDSLEVIDVDALDGDDIVYVGSAPPRQRRRIAEDGRAAPVSREVIHIPDEDDDEVQIVRHIPRPSEHPPVRRERIFSPPPPPQIGGIPPVPPIPQRFRAMRQRPPGLVIPNEEPFPFEADLRPSPPAVEPVPNAAPPSHHVPSMGLGGALLAGVRRFMGSRSHAERPHRHAGWGVSGSFIVRWDPFDFPDDLEDDMLDDIPFMDEVDDPYAAGRVRRQLERAFKRHPERQPESDYKPEYTHPDKPLPGFTHDFAPASSPSSPIIVLDDSSSGSSSSSSRACEATLVCSSCRDPLMLGASDIGEGRDGRKLWGLRCGHLLDGKCIEKLMKPIPPVSDESASSRRRTSLEIPSSSGQDAVNVTVDTEFTSMRSRLRPRRRMPGASSSLSQSAQATSSGPRGLTRAQGSHRGKGKGKGKMKAPAVEAEHEWSCPVSGCGHVHLSLLMGGRWTMDEKRGAIPVFV